MSVRWSDGDRFGRYVIEGLLGKGGMGEVYVARDTQLGRRVALKVLHGAGDDATLLREARAAAAIDHPNVAQVFDVDAVDGVPFIAMELVEGRPLRAYVGDPSVTFETKIRWLVGIGRALEAAHARGIVHRDVKPENVIVRADGVVKVLDFGIARAVPLVDRSAETRTGPGTPQPVVTEPGATHGTNVKGTLAYMAPEQVRGETIDAATDQWAWGIVAYELLAGELPWRATQDRLALVAEILSREPEAIRGVGAEVNAVVARARAKRRAERFAGMGEAIRALEESTAAARLEKASRARSFRALLVAGLFGAVALVGAALARSNRAVPGPGPTSPSSALSAAPPDYGSRMSGVPEAMAAYVKGVEGQNGGATSLTLVALFARARKLDPEFAAAYLRALLSVTLTEDTYQILQQLQQRRGALSAHDRALLEAIEPWFRVPQDSRELRRRLDLLPWQTDADYGLQRCRFLLQLNAYTEAMESCRSAQRLSPALAAAYLGEGIALSGLGDLEGTDAAFHACISQSPSASRCVKGLADVQGLRGACAERLSTLEHAIDIVPTESDVRRQYALAVLARDMRDGRDAVSYRVAADAYVASFAQEGTSESQIQAERAYYESFALIAEGRLAEAIAALEQILPFYRPTNLELDIGSIYSTQAPLLLELGKTPETVAFARRWLEEREAWVPNAYMNSRIQPLALLYRVGALARERFLEERRLWLVEADKGNSGDRPALWSVAYADSIASRADAEEALAARSHFQPFPVLQRRILVDANVGRALLRAGQVEEAVRLLRAAVRGCDAGFGAFLFIHALSDLGDALTRTSNVAEACDAYAAVLARWGNARGSVTAQHAQTQRAALHCGSLDRHRGIAQ